MKNIYNYWLYIALLLQMVQWRPWSPLTKEQNGRRCADHRTAIVTLRPQLTGLREWDTLIHSRMVIYITFKYILFCCHVHVFFIMSRKFYVYDDVVLLNFNLTLSSMSVCSEHVTLYNISLIIVSLQCRLHIHASYSTTMKMNVPMLPLSQPNAVGLILAHGKKKLKQNTHLIDLLHCIINVS